MILRRLAAHLTALYHRARCEIARARAYRRLSRKKGSL